MSPASMLYFSMCAFSVAAHVERALQLPLHLRDGRAFRPDQQFRDFRMAGDQERLFAWRSSGRSTCRRRSRSTTRLTLSAEGRWPRPLQ